MTYGRSGQGQPQRWPRAGLMALAALFALAAFSPGSARAEPAKVEADLIAPVTAIRAGEAFSVGLRQRIAPEWHTYWKNPGDSGEPALIEWELPEGFSASPIAWPVPEAIPYGPLMNYGYSDEVLLPVTITPPDTLSAGSVTLRAKVDILVCKDICIPEKKDVSLTLDVAEGAAEPSASPHAAMFETAARQAPIPLPWATGLDVAAETMTLRVAASGLDAQRISSAYFFADAWGLVAHAAPQPVSWEDGQLRLALQRGDLAGEPLEKLTGLLVLTETLDSGDVRNAFTLEARPGPAVKEGSAAAGPATSPAAPPSDPPAGPPLSLWQAAFLALLGGLILNLMPCVLPILSLKVMALARGHDDASRRARTAGAMAYAGGVLVSFALFAAVLVALRGAGEAIGWGFQFQSPLFVLAMAALFLALGLSMSGVFHIGGSLVGIGSGLVATGGPHGGPDAGRPHTHWGSFLTGVLATIAATPCTAPFMGAAIGFALASSALATVIVMLALGLGFALPVVLLAVSGAAARLLPRPGAWMETLKQALAFPLYATVAWLVWVLSIQSGSDGVLAAAFVLTGVAAICWIAGQSGASGMFRAATAAAVMIVVLAASWPLVASLDGTGEAPVAATGGGSTARPAATGDDVSEPRIAELRASGRNVFVNLTAAWCITCKVNERVALDTDGVRRALAETGTVYLKGDWTRRDETIGRLLAAHGRAGVPLYLLYPADPAAAAIVLPQLLTEGIVVSHLMALPPAPRQQAATTP